MLVGIRAGVSAAQTAQETSCPDLQHSGRAGLDLDPSVGGHQRGRRPGGPTAAGQAGRHGARPPVGRAPDRPGPVAGHRAGRAARGDRGRRRPSPADAHRPDLGVGRDRPHGARHRPRVRRQRAVLHLHRRQPPGRPRRADPGVEDERRGDPGDVQARPALRLPGDQWPPRRLPAADPRQRRAPGRHGRRRHRHQPAGQDVARRQDADARPGHGRAVAEQPVHRRRQPASALRAHLRAPQRAGPRPAQGRHPVVRRARPRPRRRGQPPARTAATTAGTPSPATTSRSR